jgi:hypothetical protein
MVEGDHVISPTSYVRYILCGSWKDEGRTATVRSFVRSLAGRIVSIGKYSFRTSLLPAIVDLVYVVNARVPIQICLYDGYSIDRYRLSVLKTFPL